MYLDSCLIFVHVASRGAWREQSGAARCMLVQASMHGGQRVSAGQCHDVQLSACARQPFLSLL